MARGEQLLFAHGSGSAIGVCYQDVNARQPLERNRLRTARPF
jgi:hypothetical protein